SLPSLFVRTFSLSDPTPTPLYTLSLHDALPICPRPQHAPDRRPGRPVLPLQKQPDERNERYVLLERRDPTLRQDRLRHRDHNGRDRKSTRLNSSHVSISYAVFCLKKKKKPNPYK